MNDDELRMLIRAAVQRHLHSDYARETAGELRRDRLPSHETAGELRRDTLPSHQTAGELRRDTPPSISFGQYRIERAAGDTECIIEPAVQCNHCGFCKCHGH